MYAGSRTRKETSLMFAGRGALAISRTSATSFSDLKKDGADLKSRFQLRENVRRQQDAEGNIVDVRGARLLGHLEKKRYILFGSEKGRRRSEIPLSAQRECTPAAGRGRKHR